jgi:hypothetical protein
LALVKKELQQARKDNQVLTRYIHARRKEEVRKKEEDTQNKAEEEARKKAEEEARRKETMVLTRWSNEGQSSKDVWT